MMTTVVCYVLLNNRGSGWGGSASGINHQIVLTFRRQSSARRTGLACLPRSALAARVLYCLSYPEFLTVPSFALVSKASNFHLNFIAKLRAAGPSQVASITQYSHGACHELHRRFNFAKAASKCRRKKNSKRIQFPRHYFGAGSTAWGMRPHAPLSARAFSPRVFRGLTPCAPRPMPNRTRPPLTRSAR